MTTYDITVVGFAGELFAHYLPGDPRIPARFETLAEARAYADRLHAETGRVVVVLAACQQTYCAGA